MRGQLEFQRLQYAIAKHTPKCLGDDTFVADELTREEIELMEQICLDCPIFTVCLAFAKANKPTAGFWAGKQYSAHGTEKE